MSCVQSDLALKIDTRAIIGPEPVNRLANSIIAIDVLGKLKLGLSKYNHWDQKKS